MMKRQRDIAILALSIALTMAAGWLWITLFDWTLSQGGVRAALVRYVPSLILVGAGIGFGSMHLHASARAAGIGACYGWIAGTVVGLLVFELNLNNRVLELALFYVLQILSGITLGLMPAFWTWSVRNQRR